MNELFIIYRSSDSRSRRLDMAAKLILASCALLLALIAVDAEVTCGPTQWEAVRFSKPGRSLSVVNVAVDYKAKKEAFHESIYVNENVTLKYSTFRDWNKVRGLNIFFIFLYTRLLGNLLL